MILMCYSVDLVIVPSVNVLQFVKCVLQLKTSDNLFVCCRKSRAVLLPESGHVTRGSEY